MDNIIGSYKMMKKLSFMIYDGQYNFCICAYHYLTTTQLLLPSHKPFPLVRLSFAFASVINNNCHLKIAGNKLNIYSDLWWSHLTNVKFMQCTNRKLFFVQCRCTDCCYKGRKAVREYDYNFKWYFSSHAQPQQQQQKHNMKADKFELIAFDDSIMNSCDSIKYMQNTSSI